jgi:hypothetical protein
MVRFLIIFSNESLIELCRLQAMQKMQAAAGGKGRGAGGMPTPAQIQAMQVSVHDGIRHEENLTKDSAPCHRGCYNKCKDKCGAEGACKK